MITLTETSTPAEIEQHMTEWRAARLQQAKEQMAAAVGLPVGELSFRAVRGQRGAVGDWAVTVTGTGVHHFLCVDPPAEMDGPFEIRRF